MAHYFNQFARSKLGFHCGRMKMHTEIIRPKTDIMLSAAADIDTLCSEIKKLGITFFSHTRIFDDGSRIDLNNHAAMIEEFYYGKDKMYELYTPEIKPKCTSDEILLLDNLEDNPSFQFLREGYNIDHMLVKIEKHKTYCDVWNFGTTTKNKTITRLYLNHLDLLVLFTHFYKDKCQSLIQLCEQDPIVINETQQSDNIFSDDSNLIEEIRTSLQEKTNRYYLNGISHLTKSEIKCCYWIYQGKTNEEIAAISYRSKKTIEKHVENIKAKLSCYSKSELVNKIRKFGIF